MVTYTFNETAIHIEETPNEKDVTFRVEIKSEAMRDRIKELRNYLNNDKDYTDALFYTDQQGVFEIIVRNDYYLKFLTEAFRFHCLESLHWNE
ncbi:hypothetical protein ABE137_03420 [Brevibacillus laterosporus]|uniref:Uncharacterized protein n=2 Tax=Brevibacillus TaxID=55080 RepID=A0A0F7C195_BRELA|nr:MULTISPECIES: hypothetical protein [Brevibacillus]AKF95407.1 hypothetical protein EX87_17440 [Brevibacillus laterosporus]MCR8986152.1 hypothetical protein [Brevibacillus laterosporus]MCZ0831885.1 hypothetical protein [Brevibacillus halotolerans]OAJ75076.1 hypothetical protein AYJ08_05505 [Brevibacillus sp. SKDU10]GIO00264.1 hypothetical protein J5TS2_09320 [Brevibacillus halotolerans]